jgi:hypothetical protein
MKLIYIKINKWTEILSFYQLNRQLSLLSQIKNWNNNNKVSYQNWIKKKIKRRFIWITPDKKHYQRDIKYTRHVFFTHKKKYYFYLINFLYELITELKLIPQITCFTSTNSDSNFISKEKSIFSCEYIHL